MDDFLLWIGAYNILGALVLPFLTREALAERVLGKWLQVLAVPYSHGEHGPFWIYWAAITNLFLGVVMVIASRWSGEPQEVVTAAAVGVYVLSLLLGLGAMRSPRYKRANVGWTLTLWVAQAAWGAYALWRG